MKRNFGTLNFLKTLLLQKSILEKFKFLNRKFKEIINFLDNALMFCANNWDSILNSNISTKSGAGNLNGLSSEMECSIKLGPIN